MLKNSGSGFPDIEKRRSSWLDSIDIFFLFLFLVQEVCSAIGCIGGWVWYAGFLTLYAFSDVFFYSRGAMC